MVVVALLLVDGWGCWCLEWLAMIRVVAGVGGLDSECLVVKYMGERRVESVQDYSDSPAVFSLTSLRRWSSSSHL